jgi:hypothetical protein
MQSTRQASKAFKLVRTLSLSQGKVQSTLTLNDWARYINRINRQYLTKLITAITSGVYA